MKLAARPVLAVAVALSFVAGGAALAAPKLPKPVPLTVTDPAGDANFSNRQGGLLPAAPPALPGSLRQGADITAVGLGRLDRGNVVKALTVTMKLAGPPEEATQYRVAMSAPGCDVYYVEYQNPPAGSDAVITKGGLIRENCTGESVFTDVDATITGNTIVWTIPVKGMPGDLKLGTPLTVEYGQTNFETAAVFPAFDDVVIGKTFKIGQ